LTPLRAVRAHCLWCCLGSFQEVRLCPATGCPSWPLRMGRRAKGSRPLRAIRTQCLDCCGYEPGRVRKCPHTACPLHRYRFGHRPPRAGG